MHVESTAPTPANISAQNGSAESNGTVTSLTQLLSVSKTVLLQAVDLLDNYLTSDDQLTMHSKFLPGSTIGISNLCQKHLSHTNITIGKHLRHARDHFVLLVKCISSPQPHVLSYDTRNRNTPMESNRSAAREALVETIQHLETVILSTQMNAPITLHAVTPHPQQFETTFGREVRTLGLLPRNLLTYRIALVCGSPLRPSLVDGTDSVHIPSTFRHITADSFVRFA